MSADWDLCVKSAVWKSDLRLNCAALWSSMWAWNDSAECDFFMNKSWVPYTCKKELRGNDTVCYQFRENVSPFKLTRIAAKRIGNRKKVIADSPSSHKANNFARLHLMLLLLFFFIFSAAKYLLSQLLNCATSEWRFSTLSPANFLRKRFGSISSSFFFAPPAL